MLNKSPGKNSIGYKTVKRINELQKQLKIDVGYDSTNKMSIITPKKDKDPFRSFIESMDQDQGNFNYLISQYNGKIPKSSEKKHAHKFAKPYFNLKPINLNYGSKNKDSTERSDLLLTSKTNETPSIKKSISSSRQDEIFLEMRRTRVKNFTSNIINGKLKSKSVDITKGKTAHQDQIQIRKLNPDIRFTKFKNKSQSFLDKIFEDIRSVEPKEKKVLKNVEKVNDVMEEIFEDIDTQKKSMNKFFDKDDYKYDDYNEYTEEKDDESIDDIGDSIQAFNLLKKKSQIDWELHNKNDKMKKKMINSKKEIVKWPTNINKLNIDKVYDIDNDFNEHFNWSFWSHKF